MNNLLVNVWCQSWEMNMDTSLSENLENCKLISAWTKCAALHNIKLFCLCWVISKVDEMFTDGKKVDFRSSSQSHISTHLCAIKSSPFPSSSSFRVSFRFSLFPLSLFPHRNVSLWTWNHVVVICWWWFHFSSSSWWGLYFVVQGATQHKNKPRKKIVHRLDWMTGKWFGGSERWDRREKSEKRKKKSHHIEFH